MPIVEVTLENLDKEHICCAISDKKGETCVSRKKAWMTKAFSQGLRFHKLDERGKVFIEYLPSESAWAPIVAENFFYINCLWVSGKYKGQGYANQLLHICVEEAQKEGKEGIVILSSQKKKPFLSEPGYLKHKGFMVTDTAPPYYELLYLPLKKSCHLPQFKECVKDGMVSEKELSIYYTDQCPHTDKYANLLEKVAKEQGVLLKIHRIEDVKEAQNAPNPFTTYSFFYEGKFVTNEIFSEKKLLEFLKERNAIGQK